jgi:phasin
MPHRNKNVALHKKCCYMCPIVNERRRRASSSKGWKMSKSPRTIENSLTNVEFPAFDASKAADQVRAFAEKGIEQSKETYAKLKTGAEEAQKALESTFETVKSVGSDVSLKTIAALRANSEAGFSHLEALVGAKSLSEVIELQTAFIRKSVETAVEQTKELQAVTTKAAEDVSKPIKTVFEKSFNDLKVA